ncbi:FAHD1-like protein [Mya arenaria]|uniref:oxaloacetate tautomerase n=1 Tax=Mya arenaria TaxID=6604 RepID=A0ABY7FM01_MYAAR|nr:acylpyruvase FAHD1, mitochondrial-like [Mya arenaria]WAR22194.1 FAHD1-like protein [Mya arenaria]
MASKVSQFMQLGRKIVAVGRNYKAHAHELGNALPSKPMLFLKPTSSYIAEGEKIRIPEGCTSLHHEVELGIVIGKPGSRISEQDAASHIGGYILALDMTARDFQEEAKKKGHPWSLAKGFDTSCPVSGFIDKDKISDPSKVRLWLKVNDSLKQDGNTGDMIFSIPHLISYISRYFRLEEGDVILTGTPEGVGPVGSGDVIEAGLSDVVTMKFQVEQS